jgi:hypothetical protein
MRIVDAQQVGLPEILSESIDLVIAASGYERRSTAIAERLGKRPSGLKVVLGFAERKVLSREKNDGIFERLGYKIEAAVGNEGVKVESIVGKFLKENEGRRVTILIDYSCMTRLWYAAVIRLMRNLGRRKLGVKILFCYTPAAFLVPKPPLPNLHISPISGFFNIQLPISKTALVIGLGYEAHHASGLVDYVEAAETYAFLSDPSFDSRFTTAVEKNNEDLMSRIGREHVIRYPVMDLRATEALLSSLCAGLWKEYRVILAPLGPKPFTLLCLLLSAKYPMVDVWRVSSGAIGNAYDRKAAGEPLVLRVAFE